MFTYKAVEVHEDDSKKLYLMCTLLEPVGEYEAGEYFDEIHFDEKTQTFSFYYDDVQIKDDAPCMIKRLCTLDS